MLPGRRFSPLVREGRMTPQEDATLLLSRWQRERELKALRLRKIEAFRYRRWLDAMDVEPGKTPYGVRT